MNDSTTTNGRGQRKTLASQLDRLDGIIDALADGLNEAVADVVRQAVAAAVQEAVEAVLREVLARPEVLRYLAAQAAPVPEATTVEAKPGGPSALGRAWAGLKAKLAGAFTRARETVRQTRCRVGRALRLGRVGLVERVRSTWERVRSATRKAWRFRGPALWSAGVGLVSGVAGYLAGPVVSAVALGLCSAAGTVAYFLAAPFLRLARALRAQGT
jgi:hypothetical protein